jgi:putative ATP-binding cassette transporter
MMIGIGIPNSQSNTPRPNPMLTSVGSIVCVKQIYNVPIDMRFHDQELHYRHIALRKRAETYHCIAGDRLVMDSKTFQKPPQGSQSDEASDPAEDISSQDPGAEKLRRRYLVHRFWKSARKFWGRQGHRLAWPSSGAIFLIVLLNLLALYAINIWNRGIFDALEKRDSEHVFALALIYVPLLMGSVFLVVMQVYARMTTQRRWRAWLNDHLVDRWLANGRYYQLNLVSGDHQNPEFRIADDVRIATEAPVDFATGIVSAFLSAATFIIVLWTIGGTLEFSIGHLHIVIPGFLVIAAIVYSVLASGAMLLIGRRFVPVSENKNQAEAEYRYVLTRLRENGESIALIQGEEEERAGVGRSLKNVLRRGAIFASRP